jgi:hypothetical protein
MLILTQQDIDNHCARLNISRENLTEFVIPDGVTEIGGEAFEGYTSLKSINIPDSVTKISGGAFKGCSSLKSITIPDSVTEIGQRAFIRCTSLASITIPDGVTTIGDAAFWTCSSLKSITIPDSVTEISSLAFNRCHSLTSITIPNGVTKIGDWTFDGCSSLRSITIPDSVTEIGQRAFIRCWLTHVICNNPDLFTDQNTQNRDQIQFISTTKYFNDNYRELLNKLKSSRFNTEYVSSKELNLIMKLHQEDYLPNWNTIATTFNVRSMDQIRAILKHLNKTIPAKKDILLQKENDKLMTIDGLNGISMFLNPIGYTTLSMTAKNITLRSKEETQEQEHAPTSELELNMSQLQVAPSNS